MCVSCACGKPNDDHGDSRNITMQQLEQAATAANISLQEVVENIEAESARSEQGMTAGRERQ